MTRTPLHQYLSFSSIKTKSKNPHFMCSYKRYCIISTFCYRTENLITFTNATCIAKKCSIRVPRSFFLPCTEYAITMMQTGKNETRKITSPPGMLYRCNKSINRNLIFFFKIWILFTVVVGLKAQKLPFENKFQLLWTMREVALCTAGHFALEVRKENVANKQ